MLKFNNQQLEAIKQGREGLGNVSPEIPQTPQDNQDKQLTVLVQCNDGQYKTVNLNEKQSLAAKMIAENKPFVLVGAAGTGKTTCLQAGISLLIKKGNIPFLRNPHKYLIPGKHGIVQAAYTKRVVAVNKRNASPDMKDNILTIHKLLEYAPFFYEITGSDGKQKTTMRFQPTFNEYNQLDSNIHCLILDEAGTLSVDLYKEIIKALPMGEDTPMLFVGDIQQLAPVFGDAILGYKMLSLPVIELTEVYRQALDSPIIKLAHRVLSAKTIDAKEIETEWQYKDQLQIILYPEIKLRAERAMYSSINTILAGIDTGKYDYNDDIILIPQNVGFGTIAANELIANHIAKKENHVVFEIVTGYKKRYFRIGERCTYQGQECTIIDIKTNSRYVGIPYLQPSMTLDYFGHDANGQYNNDDILKSFELGNDADLDLAIDVTTPLTVNDSDYTQESSHTVTIQFNDDGQIKHIDSLSDYDHLLLGYAITVHKSQGSEWNRVFFIIHHSHNNMLNRELLYTGITRAAKQLIIICERDTFIRGINRQAIKGNTIEAKAEFFKGRGAECKLKSII